MTHRIAVGIITVLCFTAISTAQVPNVKTHIQQIAKGWTTDAKKALPDLLIDYPNDPGVMFLHASLVEDPARAQPLLERIVQNFPTSEWADDATLRIIIGSCAKRDSVRAKTFFKTMRDQFAQSELLPVAYDVLRSSFNVPPVTQTTTGTPEPPKPVVPVTPPTPVQYYLKTLSTTDKEAAQKVVEALKKKRMKVQVVEIAAKPKKQYEVQVGQYNSEAEAAKDVAAVQGICNCKPTVVKR